MIFKPTHKSIQFWIKQRGQKSSTFWKLTIPDVLHDQLQKLASVEGSRSHDFNFCNDNNILKSLSTEKQPQCSSYSTELEIEAGDQVAVHLAQNKWWSQIGHSPCHRSKH